MPPNHKARDCGHNNWRGYTPPELVAFKINYGPGADRLIQVSECRECRILRIRLRDQNEPVFRRD